MTSWASSPIRSRSAAATPGNVGGAAAPTHTSVATTGAGSLAQGRADGLYSSTAIIRTIGRLGQRLGHNGEVDELRSTIEDFGHRRPRRLQLLLALRIALSRASVLLALEHDQRVDPARVILVSHHQGAHQARIWLFGSTQQIDNPLYLPVLALLQTHGDQLCPHTEPLVHS